MNHNNTRQQNTPQKGAARFESCDASTHDSAPFCRALFGKMSMQGRDFNLLEEVNHLPNAEMSVEGNYNNIDGIIGNAPVKDDYEAKTLREQIEYNKSVSERNNAPVDGHEPQKIGRY
jgi:hypothetical protein